MTTAFETDRSRYDLQQKLKQMEEKRETLLAEVEAEYNETKLRDLRILDHHIQVASERINGEWFRDDYSPIEIIR